ncbi:hypothetical protein GPJ56_010789 [Histomonas meleagridis]|uniref:uncharacterized protein n=1 Tax=Histomonas meleagridis TaxID=135588 RepID=UPI00355A2150|nr:hypothetical protein GPJ56_010789 [Histomonas meleagridis]KAH0801126.1 hypothetical protein GO595_006161 [Histomonas meleagridis]
MIEKQKAQIYEKEGDDIEITMDQDLKEMLKTKQEREEIADEILKHTEPSQNIASGTLTVGAQVKELAAAAVYCTVDPGLFLPTQTEIDEIGEFDDTEFPSVFPQQWAELN